MEQIRARNVNEAYVIGAQYLTQYGERMASRGGDVIVAIEPVTTHYTNPTERVLFYEERDANPFFHLFESLWILAGRNDLSWLTRFNKRMADYSDNGTHINGSAYGFRLRKYFYKDQIKAAIDELSRDPNSRRVYMQIFSGQHDLGSTSKDIPCNVGIKLEMRKGKLNMVVFNRSNDMIWGAYGANAVHFSMLQEYIAGHIGCQIGWYEQISTNFHIYTNVLDKYRPDMRALSGIWDPYEMGEVSPFPLIGEANPVDWDLDCHTFMKEASDENIAPVLEYKTPFFKYVASPMLDAWEAWEDKEKYVAITAAEECRASDWRTAAIGWLNNRRRKWEQN